METLKECKVECMMEEKVCWFPSPARLNSLETKRVSTEVVGCTSLSFPTSISRSNDCIPLVDRRNPSITSSNGFARFKRRRSSFRNAAASSTQVTRSFQIFSNLDPVSDRRRRSRTRYPFRFSCPTLSVTQVGRRLCPSEWKDSASWTGGIGSSVGRTGGKNDAKTFDGEFGQRRRST